MKTNLFNQKHGYFIEELQVNQQAFLERTITEGDIVKFSQVSGDDNPVHLSDEFAKHTIFKKRVAHGFFTASLISTVIATKLPGPGSIYLNQTLNFLAPAFIGDTVQAIVKIIKIIPEKRKIELLTECFISEKKILTGEAKILVDSKNK